MMNENLARAKREIAAVEQALKAGYPREVRHGGIGQVTAVGHAAKLLNVPRRSLADRVGQSSKRGLWERMFNLAPDWSLYKPKASTPEAVKETNESERREIASQDEIRRLRTQLRDAHRHALNDEAMREILGSVASAPVVPPKWLNKPATKRETKAEVPVAIWSDWHFGEVVDRDEVRGVNEYNIEIGERRVERLVNTTIDICKRHHTSGEFPGMVINLLGDFVSGGLHPELLRTDEEENIPAALRVRDVLVAAIARMADEIGKLYIPCAAGNHGRATAKPEFKRYVYKNFDWLIYQLLIRHFKNDKRIVFDCRPSNDVHYRVYGERYLACHGDMLGVKGGDGHVGILGPVARGEIKKSRQATAVGEEYDVLLMGHYHQPLTLPRAIVANSLKGWDEYARLQLGAPPTRPSQPLWFVHPSRGRTSFWEVYVDEPLKGAEDWISILNDGA